MNDKLQQYESHKLTIEALLEDISNTVTFNRERVRNAPSHAAGFLIDIQLAEASLIEALKFLTGEDD